MSFFFLLWHLCYFMIWVRNAWMSHNQYHKICEHKTHRGLISSLTWIEINHKFKSFSLYGNTCFRLAMVNKQEATNRNFCYRIFCHTFVRVPSTGNWISFFMKNLCSRCRQKAELGSLRSVLRMCIVEAESKNLLCRRRRSGGGDRLFSLIFFANFKLIIALNFAWKVLWSYFYHALYWRSVIELFYGRNLSLHLLRVTQFMQSQYYFEHSNSSAYKAYLSSRLRPFSKTVHVLCNLFNVSVRQFVYYRLQLNNMPICGCTG